MIVHISGGTEDSSAAQASAQGVVAGGVGVDGISGQAVADADNVTDIASNMPRVTGHYPVTCAADTPAPHAVDELNVNDVGGFS